MLQSAKHRVAAYLSADAPPLSTRWIVSLALAATAFLLLLMDMEIGVYDESLVMQGAVEVIRGHVPHRDFFWTYGPMQLWALAALFVAFARTVIVARVYDVVLRGGVVLVCGLIARRLGLRAGLVAASMLFETILLFVSGFPLYPVFPSMLCALAGTLLLVDDKPGAEVRRNGLLGAGMLTGLTALFRYDIGFLVLVAHVACLGYFALHWRESPGRLTGQVVLYGLGVGIVFLPVAILAWASGALPGFIHDIVRFPPANYARMRGLPWPKPGLSGSSLLLLVCYVPFAAAALGASWLISCRKRRLDAPGRMAAALLVMVTLFILKGVVRMSLVQSMLALVPAILLLVFLLARTEGRAVRAGSLAVLVFVLEVTALKALSIVASDRQAAFASLLPARIAGSVPAAIRGTRCAALPTLGLGVLDNATFRAACYIALHTRAGDRIYVGAGRHDKIFVNNVAPYFATDRQPGTRWYHLEPGLQTQAPIQREIIGELLANDVRLIAIDTRYDNANEPNDSAVSSGVHLLDRFLRSRFVKVAEFGGIEIRALPGSVRDDDAPDQRAATGLRSLNSASGVISK